MFENYKVFETEFAGKKMKFETGKMCCLSNGSVLVHYGETVVLVNVTASRQPREGIDFFPLSVDFEEKLYAVGKIPGSYKRREGKPSDKAILTCKTAKKITKKTRLAVNRVSFCRKFKFISFCF